MDRSNMSICTRLAIIALLGIPVAFGADAAVRETVASKIAAEYPSLETLYKDLHGKPELSLMEERTAGVVARELRAAGFEVTDRVGGFGVVGASKNGSGPTLIIGNDCDGLELEEQQGLPRSSKSSVNGLAGSEVATMHACGHDIHMTVFAGTARVLAAMKERWSGTLVVIGQPA